MSPVLSCLLLFQILFKPFFIAGIVSIPRFLDQANFFQHLFHAQSCQNCYWSVWNHVATVVSARLAIGRRPVKASNHGFAAPGPTTRNFAHSRGPWTSDFSKKPFWTGIPFWPENQRSFESMGCWTSLPFHLPLFLAYWQANEAHVSWFHEISCTTTGPTGFSTLEILTQTSFAEMMLQSFLVYGLSKWTCRSQILQGVPVYPLAKSCLPCSFDSKSSGSYGPRAGFLVGFFTKTTQEPLKWCQNLGIFERNSWKLGKIGG